MSAKKETERKVISAVKPSSDGSESSKRIDVEFEDENGIVVMGMSEGMADSLKEEKIDPEKWANEFFSGKSMINLPDADLELKEFPPKRIDVIDPDTGEMLTDDALNLRDDPSL